MHFWCECKLVQPLQKMVWRFFKLFQIKISCDLKKIFLKRNFSIFKNKSYIQLLILLYLNHSALRTEEYEG